MRVNCGKPLHCFQRGIVMKSKTKNTTHKIVFAALMAAITCVMTIAIRIPSPTGGYLNMGDVAVLTSCWLLGPLWGSLAAGIGSALADIFSGYFQYAPATFIIKGLMALLAWSIISIFRKANKKAFVTLLGNLLAFILAEALMVGLYFVFEATVLQYGMGAAAGILGNTMQGIAGVLGAIIFIEILRRTKVKEKYIG